MFISCPNCSTRYNVTSAQIGAAGKSVKCTNCGNTWHQNPVADPPPPMRPPGYSAGAPQHHAAPPPQQPYPYPPPPGYPGYPGYPPPPPGYPDYPPPPPGYPGYPPPEAAGAPGTPPPAAEAPAPPPPPPAPEPDEEDAALPDMEDEIDDDPMAAFADDMESDDEDDLSSDDIEAMFGDDDDEPEPLGSMVDSGADDDDEDEDEERGAGKGSVMKIILAAVLALLIAVLGAAFFLKDMVIEMVPAAEGIYSMIGFGDDSLGAGLSIDDVKSTRESISGKDVLVVRGVIANISDKERPVPMLELRLSDLDGKLVQSAHTVPLKKQLANGDQIGFKIQVEDPSPLARRLEVTFIERATEQTAH